MLKQTQAEGLPYVQLVTDSDNIAPQKVILSNRGRLIEEFRKPAAIRCRSLLSALSHCAFSRIRCGAFSQNIRLNTKHGGFADGHPYETDCKRADSSGVHDYRFPEDSAGGFIIVKPESADDAARIATASPSSGTAVTFWCVPAEQYRSDLTSLFRACGIRSSIRGR
jgi:hypothetical protein